LIRISKSKEGFMIPMIMKVITNGMGQEQKKRPPTPVILANLVQLLVLDGPAFGPNVTLGKLVENLFLPVQVSESEPESNSTGSSETVNVEHVSFDAGLDDK
jgi:hypothetical protein